MLPDFRDKGIYLWARTKYIFVATNTGYDVYSLDFEWKFGRLPEFEISPDGMVLLENQDLFHSSEFIDTGETAKSYHGHGLGNYMMPFHC